MNDLIQTTVGKFDLRMPECCLICRHCKWYRAFRTIKHDEEKYALEKLEFVKKFLQTEEIKDCLEKGNKQLPVILDRERQKIYYKQNAVKIREQKREHYYDNKEKQLERSKLYRDAHLEKERERCRRYYETHKEERQEKVTCECGAIVMKGCLTKHKKTNKHKIKV